MGALAALAWAQQDDLPTPRHASEEHPVHTHQPASRNSLYTSSKTSLYDPSRPRPASSLYITPSGKTSKNPPEALKFSSLASALYQTPQTTTEGEEVAPNPMVARGHVGSTASSLYAFFGNQAAQEQAVVEAEAEQQASPLITGRMSAYIDQVR